MTSPPRDTTLRSSERLKAYTDAVVAIAQTLLILPLLESVSDARAHHLTTTQWLGENGGSFYWLTMSFVLIGSFWLIHHRVFEHVEHPTAALQGLNFLWMFSIVVFPVIAAVLGLDPADNIQKMLYIGCLTLGSLAMSAMVLLINHDARIRGELSRVGAGSVAASLAQPVLYLVALVLALSIPGGTGYIALSVLVLMHPVIRLLMPLVRRLGWGD